VVQQCTDTFEVVWVDPDDSLLHWSWDKMHHPRPVPPLNIDLIASESAIVFRSRVIGLNGYVFSHGFQMPSPPPEAMQRGVQDVWENDYIPWIRDACRRWRGADYDSMNTEELLEAIDRVLAEGGEAQRLTMVPAATFSFPTNLLADFCEEALGPDGVTLAATLIQGYDNLSSRPGAALGELAAVAATSADVSAALNGRDFDRALAVDAEFSRRLDEFLEEYGWRVEGWGRYHVPTWSEDRTQPLRLIARLLQNGGSSAGDRAVAQRESALREVESRFDEEKLGRFRELLAASLAHTRISEGRAFWQLMIDGSMRAPFIALGRRLRDSGAINEPNDVFFLRLEELTEAALHPAEPLQSRVASRKADLARWERLTPPPFVGASPPADYVPETIKRAFGRFWGGEIAPSAEANVVNGNPASRGIVRGRARLIMNLGQADQLQSGEVLVCPSTAPPWTPLFAIAAAVVTDTGGVLSHSAICAREYGIPAVVGTQAGTQRIPDGAIVTVDGAAGTITIEE
jgi:pyruvate,water dikinase